MPIDRDDQTGAMIIATAKGNVPLQIAKWTEQRAFIAVTNVTARVILPAGAVLIELTATEDCYVAFGDVTVNAVQAIATDASRLFVAGVQVVAVPLDSDGVPFTYIAAIRESLNGIFQIEEVS